MSQPPFEIPKGRDAAPEEGPEVEGLGVLQNAEDEEGKPSLWFGCKSGSDTRVVKLLLRL